MLRLSVFLFALFFLVTISKVATLPTPQPSSYLEKRQPNPQDSAQFVDVSNVVAPATLEEAYAILGLGKPPMTQEEAYRNSVNSLPESSNWAQTVDVSNVGPPATSEEEYQGLDTPPMTQEEAYRNSVNSLPESSNWAQVVDVSNVVPPTP